MFWMFWCFTCAHCSCLDIYISQNFRLCKCDFESQFQTTVFCFFTKFLKNSEKVPKQCHFSGLKSSLRIPKIETTPTTDFLFLNSSGGKNPLWSDYPLSIINHQVMTSNTNFIKTRIKFIYSEKFTKFEKISQFLSNFRRIW